MDLEVLGSESWVLGDPGPGVLGPGVLGPGSGVLGPGYRVLGTGSWVVILDYSGSGLVAQCGLYRYFNISIKLPRESF